MASRHFRQASKTCGASLTALGVMLGANSMAFAQMEATALAEADAPATAPMPEEVANNQVSPQSGGIEEVVVTARRRKESAQITPVSLTALSGEDLFRAGIKEIRDLTASVPGVNFTGAGASINTVFSIRGMSRGVVGSGQPAVVTYVNEVPLSTWGGSVPTYDLESAQVLKGPQGTLFGRNTTAGAVLITTHKPTYTLEGYLLSTVGSYDWNQQELALNVPLIDNKLAVRIAGQIARRDGYTENMSFEGKDFDDIHRDNIRVSLLFEPVEGLSNLTIYEANKIDEVGTGIIFGRHTPGGLVDSIPYYNGSIRFTTIGDPNSAVPCDGDTRCDINAIAARQEQAGPRKGWTSLEDKQTQGRLLSLSNTTSFDLGPVTFKNIFGYRKVFAHLTNDIDGTELAMIDSDFFIDIKQTTDEFQIAGSALDDSLTYIAGLFYLEGKPTGPQPFLSQLFSATGTPIRSADAAPFAGAYGSSPYFYDKSKAVFGQVSYKLSGISESLAAFTVDLGVRLTRDESQGCFVPNQFLGDPAVGPEDCESTEGSSSLSSKSKKTTYTLGLNYRASDKLLLYGVTRTGYRAGGLNYPAFGGTLLPFQSYGPEEIQDFELGLKSDWVVGDVSGRFNLAAYRGNYKGLQANLATSGAGDPDGDGDISTNPTTFYVNAGDATVQGVEVDFTLLPARGLQLNLGAAWIDKTVDKITVDLPDTLPPGNATKEGVSSFAFLGSPDYSYTASVKYALPLSSDIGEVSLNARYFRISDISYGTVLSPAWDKIDLRADWFGVLLTNFDFSIFVTNVTNTDAIVGGANVSVGIGANAGFYNEPRIVAAQLRYSFGG
ncbi:MAG: TonB-dependent receptor [Gammaproteobacteria bacterium]|nr:TonB-dependent receptor [Gammaproteobacteria bacterium]